MNTLNASHDPSPETTLSLTEVLKAAWTNPFTTKSDFARAAADLIGMAASDGFITTKIATGLYGRQWLITEAGLRHLKVLGEIA